MKGTQSIKQKIYNNGIKHNNAAVIQKGRGCLLSCLPKENDLSLDGSYTILPDGFESVPPRFAIDHRNRWMIDHSDIVVTYVRSPGGAAKFKELAERRGKIVVDVAKPPADF